MIDPSDDIPADEAEFEARARWEDLKRLNPHLKEPETVVVIHCDPGPHTYAGNGTPASLWVILILMIIFACLIVRFLP